MDQDRAELREPAPTSAGPRAAIGTWVAAIMAVVLMVAGVATAYVLASRSRAAASGSAAASLSVPGRKSTMAAPSTRPEPAPSALPSPPQSTWTVAGPTTTAEDRAAILPLDVELPIWGDANALVTAVLFGDLDCRHTRRLLRSLGATKSRFGSDLRIAFRHRPLQDHASARQASQAAAAIHDQVGNGAFWALAQELGPSIGPAWQEPLRGWARRHGHDPGRVQEWASAGSAAARVTRDFDLAVRFAVRQTPTAFVNGTRIEGYRTDKAWVAEIEHELALSIDALRNGIPRRALYARRTAYNLAGVGSGMTERFCPSLDGAPVRGPSDALVTMVFFGDFACEYCRRMAPVLNELGAEYAADLRLVYKNLPHPDDELSLRLGLFAQAAWMQGGSEPFWRVHDALYQAGHDFDDARLRRVAQTAGLPSLPLLEASRQAGLTPELELMAEQAEELEIDGTPTLLVNGRRFDGLASRATLVRTLRQEIDYAKEATRHGIARGSFYHAICPAVPEGALSGSE